MRAIWKRWVCSVEGGFEELAGVFAGIAVLENGHGGSVKLELWQFLVWKDIGWF